MISAHTDQLRGLLHGFGGAAVAALWKPFPRFRWKGFLMASAALYTTRPGCNLPLFRLLLQRFQHLHGDDGQMTLTQLTTRAIQ